MRESYELYQVYFSELGDTRAEIKEVYLTEPLI